MNLLLAKAGAFQVTVYRSDGGAGPAWLWALVFAITGAILAVIFLLAVMLLRRARARRGTGGAAASREVGGGKQRGRSG